MRTFFYRNALLLILAGVFVASGIAYAVTITGQHATVASRQQEPADPDAQMQADLAAAKAKQQAVADDALGTSTRRVTADTEVIRQFVNTVATWKDGAEYAAARESVMRRYKLDKDSQFMKVYFQEPVANRDSSGKTFYAVDADGLNSNLSSVDVKVLGVSGTSYRYMVLADIASSSNDGKASASRTSVIYLSLDGDGVMSEVSGYASAAKALNSN
ncbi:hypothetical protein [Arthrobacter sp. ES1]|uniref:hypothetical protein n=1 Tax=Arthrobacter sp. ES1 TaxID=1897056 RepID=UPI001CFFBA7D|nr:hypothetical protein [Arthrobacter sp. ES1]MCB5280370.1 hypothetical protein [Arthrobacter sp. ES1]